MSRSPVLSLPIWLATAACWSVPFLIAPHTFPIPTFYSEFAAAVCWTALTIAVVGLGWRGSAGLPAVALAPLALIGVLILQLCVAPPINTFFSFAAMAFLLAAVVAIWLGARCRDLPGVLEALAVGVILGGVLTVAVELLHLFRVPGLPSQFFSITPPGTARRMWGNLNQPNHVASYLAFGLAACLFLAHEYRRWRIALAVIALTFLLGMALTFSRVTWLHVVVVGALVGLAWSTRVRGAARWLVAAAPALLLVAAYQACNWFVSYANVLWHLDLPGSLGQRMQEGAGERVLLWRHAWHMFLAHPWLGGGWGDYAWNQYVQTDLLGNVEMSLNAHNIVLDLLAKVGLLGLFAVALPAFSFAWDLRKQPMRPARAFLLSVVLVLGAHSMLEYPLHYLFFLLPLAFSLGYLDVCVLHFPSGRVMWASAGVASLCAIALLVQLWGNYASAERLQYGFASQPAQHREHRLTLLLPYENLATASQWSISPATAESLATLELKAVQFYPGPSTIQRYALALAYLGKTEDAVVQVRRLHSHYWTDYANQSWLLTQACRQAHGDALESFCVRLKSDKLLAAAGNLSGDSPSNVSQ